MNHMIEIETSNGPVRLWFDSVQQAMERIGAANLATLHEWNESLKTSSFESASLAHVQKLESEKHPRTMIHAAWMTDRRPHVEDTLCLDHGCTEFKPLPTTELVSRVVPETCGNACMGRSDHFADNCNLPKGHEGYCEHVEAK